MQGSQESHYEGMITADPNMILNATVPETVQKQAENWERGTRTLLHKSILKPAFQDPAKDFTEEPSFATGHKAVEEAQCTNLPHTEHTFWKESLPQKENVFKGQQNSSAESLQKVCREEITEFHLQESVHCVQQSSCGSKSPHLRPSRVNSAEPLRDLGLYQQKAYPAQDSLFAQTHYIKNVTSFQHCFSSASVQPLFYKDGSTRSFQMHDDTSASQICKSENFASAHKWLHYEYLKYHPQPQPAVEHLQSDLPSTACGDRARKRCCWGRPGLQATDVYHSCSSTIQRMAHTTMTMMSRNSQRTVSARKGLRPRSRRWTDSRMGSSTDFAVRQSSRHPLQVCCNSYKPTGSCNAEQFLPSAWCDGDHPFQRPVQDNAVVRSASTISTSLSPGQDGMVTTPDQQGASSEDLMDLSVEETVEYFLKMTSPLDDEFEEHRTTTTTTPSSFDALHWSFLQPGSSPL